MMFGLVLLALWQIGCAESARLLAFFPQPSTSHHFIFRPVLEALAARSHEITFVTGVPYKNVPKGIRQIALPQADYDEDYKLNFLEWGELSAVGGVREAAYFGLRVSDSLGSKEVQELIHSDQRFDAVLFEPYFGQEYGSALIHKFNAIGINIMTYGDFTWANELAGLPDNPAYQRDARCELPKELNLLERIYNTYVYLATTFSAFYYLHTVTQPLMDKYFNYTGWESRPPIDVLARNRSLILTNFNHLLGYPSPSPPHRKEIAGINIRPNKPLPQELQKYMDESKHGVIYMSLGSHFKLSNALKEVGYFIDVFRELPQRVLIKLETEYPGQLPNNVRTSKWLPQQDILAHNNCALFIAHGGLLGMTEAVYHGVPLVGVPIFSEQPKNIMYAESEGFGVMLRFRNLSRQSISWAVNEVLSNKRYKETAVRRSRMFRDRRHSPAEEAVYWIEHTLKYPFALTPKAAELSYLQLHLLDVKAFVAVSFLLAVFALWLLFRLLVTTVAKPFTKRKFKSD